jgi:3-deoxy-D-arabino-heptulosonate 7-phosphate (DAHP) synthase
MLRSDGNLLMDQVLEWMTVGATTEVEQSNRRMAATLSARSGSASATYFASDAAAMASGAIAECESTIRDLHLEVAAI